MEKLFLPQKLRKWAKINHKFVFFEFREKFKTVFILYCKFLFAVFLHRSFRKNLVPEITPKSSRPIRLQDFQMNFSPEQIDEIVSFLAC